MAGYETPATSDSPVVHIYDVCDKRLDSTHTYIDVVDTIRDSDCGYIFPNNPINNAAINFRRLNANSAGNSGKTKCNLKTRSWMLLVFLIGVVVGASFTATIFLVVSTESQTDDTSFESPPGNKTFNTSEFYSLRMIRCDVGDAPFREQRISFSVKACSDAYLVLTSEYDDSGPLLEIALGINGNTRSAIRTKIGGENLVEHLSSELNCRSFKTFWITWSSHDVIRVGRGDSSDSIVFMTLVDNRNLNFVNIGISSGRGSTGKWLFTKV